MSTTKKPVATLAKKEETKAAPAVEVKAEVKTEVKETAKKAEAPVVEVKAEAKAPAVKKAVAKPAAEKKAAPKKTAAKTTTKKAAPKKETVKKETTAKAAKASKKEVKIAIQFADKNYTAEDLTKIANDVWVYDYGKDAAELKDVQLYVKPEEGKVYYVFNNEIAGDFVI